MNKNVSCWQSKPESNQLNFLTFNHKASILKAHETIIHKSLNILQTSNTKPLFFITSKNTLQLLSGCSSISVMLSQIRTQSLQQRNCGKFSNSPMSLPKKCCITFWVKKMNTQSTSNFSIGTDSGKYMKPTQSGSSIKPKPSYASRL